MGERREHTRRECTHGGRHHHGTRNAYLADRCRCDACAAASSAYSHQRKVAIGAGRRGMIPTRAIHTHIERLTAAGMSVTEIERAAGLGSGSLSASIRRGATHVRRATANRILALTPDPGAGSSLVPAAGTHRRLQALATLGWPVSWVLAHAGVYVDLSGERRGRVRYATAAAVSRSYDTLWNTPPPTNTPARARAVTATRKRATRHRWPGPLAWDDDTIDDPHATPAPRPRGTSRRVHVDDIEHLVDMGMHLDAVATACEVTVEAIVVALQRSGRSDLRDRLHAREPDAQACPGCGHIYPTERALQVHQVHHCAARTRGAA